jgi:hypothetical protein
MFNQNFTEPNHVAPDGFVSVLDGEIKRQKALAVRFRDSEPALYARALAAARAVRTANADFDTLKADLTKVLQPGQLVDLLAQVDAEARAGTRAPATPTVSQIAQQERPVESKPKATRSRKVSTSVQDGAHERAVMSDDPSEQVPAY